MRGNARPLTAAGLGVLGTLAFLLLPPPTPPASVAAVNAGEPAAAVVADWQPAATLRATPGVEGVRCHVVRADAEAVEVTYAVPPVKPVATTLAAAVGGEDAVAKDGPGAERRQVLAALTTAAAGRQPVRLAMGNAPSVGGAGRPVLPVVPAKLMIPFGRELAKVEVVLGQKVTLDGKYFVLPGQPPVPILPDAQAKFVPPDPAIYGADQPYPANRHSAPDVQRRRGVTYVLVNLNPVEYRPQSGALSYYASVSLKLTTKPATSAPALRYRPDPVRPLGDGVDNPATLDTYGTAPGRRGPGIRGICDPAQSFQYVVITSAALKNAPSDPATGAYNFQDLLAFKATQGLSGTIVTTEDIYAAYTGVDHQEKIRNFIIDAYNNWETDFVLLGGDGDGAAVGGESEAAVVPARILDCTYVYPHGNIASDLYYQCLDGTWNDNGDGLYGRPGDGPGGGEVDTHAEVYVGRAMVSAPTHVSAFVAKTIRYANARNAAYVTTALMVGEYLGFGGASNYATGSMEEVRTGGTFNGVTCVGIPDYFTVDTLYDSASFTWAGTDLAARVNSDQYNMIHHLGHCGNYRLMKLNATTGPGDLASIVNHNLVVIYSQGCFPGAFDNYYYGTSDYVDYDAIGEKLLRDNQYGMAAGVLNSRYGWGAYDSTDGPSQWYHREFVDAYFGEYLFNLGAINADSHEDNAWRLSGDMEGYARWCMYETNLFGDPHLVLNGLSAVANLAYSSHTASDAAPGGNGDAVVNPGETVQLTVSLRNRGLDPASGVTATLVTADAAVTVTDSTAAFGAVPGAGAAKTALDPFTIAVSPACPTPHEVTLDLNITDAAAHVWTASFKVLVYTSGQISGTVVRATGGAGIAGATVSYTGPRSGTAATGADGTYAFSGIDGTYTLAARAAGCLDSEPRTVTIPPSATGVDFALGMSDIDVTPAALALTAVEGTAATTPLNVGNLGDATLAWTAPPSEYEVTDSDHVGGPTYAWTEIADTGTEITGLVDDSNAGPFDVGFSFPFYGKTFASFRVCSNGWLSFTSAATSYVNSTLPNIAAPENLVAFCWDDLYFVAGSTAWYQLVDADTLVVEFKDVAFWSNRTKKLTCQAVLKPDGSLTFQYQAVGLATACTVGVQNADLTKGCQVVYNAAYLHDAMAVTLRQGYGAGWLTVSPAAGAVAPAAAQALAVTASAAMLDAGTHHATLTLAANDLDESLVTVPVTFTVTPGPRLGYRSQTIGDDATPPAAGDGDGVAEPGETVAFGVTIVNTGHAPATGLTGVLSSRDPHVTLASTSSSFPDAAAGAEVAAALPYVLQLAPTCPARHDAPLTLTVTDDAGHQWPLAVNLAVTAHAQLAVSPPSLEQTLPAGQTAGQPLTLGNTGTLALAWMAVTGLEGYTVTTSDEAGGPAYAWTDIAGTGTEIVGLADDANLGPFDLGFPFPLYGGGFTSFRVCANGWLSFTSTATRYSNTALPHATAPENLVAFCWDDLIFVTGSTAWYQLRDPSTLVVEFKDVAFWSDRTKKLTCQAILKADGTMLFLYETIAIADACTVGVQNAERTKGVQVVCNAPRLHAGLAVRLTPTADWLTLKPSAGTGAPGESAMVTATFNATGLAAGTYTTTIQVPSNDWRTPLLNIPATLAVTAEGNPPVIVSPAWADPNPVTLPAGTAVHVVAGDPDGDALSYAWRQVSGAGTATFAAPAAADSGVTISPEGSYVLRVTIGDGHGGAVTSDVAVTVKPCPADVNRDGVVNALDLQLVIANFGRLVGSPGCDPRADANGDGGVNALDLQLVIASFGKTVRGAGGKCSGFSVQGSVRRPGGQIAAVSFWSTAAEGRHADPATPFSRAASAGRV